MADIRELKEELKLVLSGRGWRMLDSFLPLLAFLTLQALFGLHTALAAALAAAGLLAAARVIRRESVVYALGGVGGVLLAGLFATINTSEAGFFLPGLISGSITVLVCVASAAVNRPAAAWTSHLTRRWPLEWYWHPKVLPAYNEVTIGWAVGIAARLALEFWLYQGGEINLLGAARLLLGWPFTIFLLVLSYLYGMRRLRNLKGPGVAEFKEGKAPPWVGQQRGF